MTRIFLQRTLLIIFCGSLLAIAGWSGYKVYTLSSERAEIKKDYSVLNNITHGLLSVNAWRDHMIRVVTRRIDDFELTAEQEKALKYEVSQVLHAVIDKADSMLDKKQKTIGGKLKKLAIRTFVKEEKLHAQVPVFAQTIVNEIKKPKNKEKLKFLVQSKMAQFGAITYDSVNDVKRIESIIYKYEAAEVAEFNITSQSMLDGLQERTYFYTFVILTIMIMFLVMWWLLRFQKTLYTPPFVISVLLALAVLFVGLTTPMIEIDARIKEMSVILLGENMSFHDQVIFFQSKFGLILSVILQKITAFEGKTRSVKEKQGSPGFGTSLA